MDPYVHSSTIYNSQCWKLPKCLSVKSGSINFHWYIYTVEYYTAERKKELTPFAMAWMEMENIMLSEISQAVKDKYRMIPTISGT